MGPTNTAALRKLRALAPTADGSACRAALGRQKGDVGRAALQMMAAGVVSPDQLDQGAMPPTVWLFARAYTLYQAFRRQGASHAQASRDALETVHDAGRQEIGAWLTYADQHVRLQEDQASGPAKWLRSASGASLSECQAALNRAGGDAEAALRSLIVSGASNLDPRRTTPEHWALLRLREWAGRLAGVRSGKAAALRKRLLPQLAGKRPVEEAVLAAGARARAAALRGKPLNLVHVPGLPPLRRGEGRAALPSWKGFWRQGRVSVHFEDVPCLGLEVTVPKEQSAAWGYLTAHGDAVRDAVIAAVFDWLSVYADRFDEFSPRRPIRVPGDLRANLMLRTVFVSAFAKRGCAFVGLGLRCSWDEEHGLSVMTHRDRVIGVGDWELAWSDLPMKHSGRRLRP
jgi:hypothetical protein